MTFSLAYCSRLTWFLFPVLASVASASFSLNVSGPDWDYTVKNLKSPTSNRCKEAYSASVECTYTLVGIVASMRPAFGPDAADLDAMCTTGCSEALQQYVDNVQSNCALPEDAAEVLINTTKPYQYGDSPVELVGQLFQYEYAQACRKATNGTYCYLANSAWADPNYDCNDVCYTSFYQNVHNFPASAYWFNYYELLPQSDYWIELFKEGYNRLMSCGKASPDSSTTLDSAATLVASDSSSAMSTAESTMMPATQTPTSSTTSSTISNASATPTTTSNGANIVYISGHLSAMAAVAMLFLF